MSRLCIILSVSSLLVCGGEATTYFINTGGSDAADGLSRATAWRSIQHAVDQAAPGDDMVVQSGVYTGARIRVSGTLAQSIRLRAETNLTVTIAWATSSSTISS